MQHKLQRWTNKWNYISLEGILWWGARTPRTRSSRDAGRQPPNPSPHIPPVGTLGDSLDLQLCILWVDVIRTVFISVHQWTHISLVNTLVGTWYYTSHSLIHITSHRVYISLLGIPYDTRWHISPSTSLHLATSWMCAASHSFAQKQVNVASA